MSQPAQPSAKPAPKNYYTALDGIRGLGLFLVLIAHFRLFYLLELTPIHAWEDWFLQLMDFNWVAMEWFFAMSGFLITGILLKSKTQEGYFKNFYIRRFLRIFPLYYAFLAIYFFVMPRFMDMANNPESAYAFVSEHQGWYWTYFGNFLLAMQGDWLGEMSHFWSLAVEEHFYMVWPFLVYFMAGRRLMIFSAVGVVASIALRAYLVWGAGMSPVSIYVMTPTRVDSLLMGSMLAVLASQAPNFARLVAIRKPLTLVSLLSIPLLVWFYAKEGHFSAVGELAKTQQQGHLYPYVVVFGYFLVGVMSCTLVVWLLTGGEKHWLRRIFNHGFLRMLGQYSYGMYVIHFAVFGLFHQSPLSISGLSEAFGSRALGVPVAFILPFLATLAGAWAIWHGFEKHFIKLKRYFETDAPRRAIQTPVIAAPATAAGGTGP